MQRSRDHQLSFFSVLSLYIFPILLFSILLASCQTQHPRHPVSYTQSQQALQQGIDHDRAMMRNANTTHLPRNVSDALLSGGSATYASDDQSYTSPKERRFDVVADNMPAKTFFMGLVQGTSINMVVNPEVTGNITLNLKQVTIDDAMMAVQDSYGYTYRKTAFGYEVFPRKLHTAMFNVNYLDVKRIGHSTTELSSGQISENLSSTTSGGPGTSLPPVATSSTTTSKPSGSTVKTESSVDFWRELKLALNGMMGSDNGHSIVVNPQAGVVTVRAYPDEIREIRNYLTRIQSHMSRQVIIEAKILEVNLSDQFQSGIDWNVLGKGDSSLNEGGMAQDGTAIFNKPLNTDLANFNTIFTLNAGKGSFNLLVKLLQTQGNVQVLSSPRISTVNNQKAVIKVGTDEFYVTAVSTDNTITATSTIPTQDVTLTPFFSGITFDVTPEIAGDGTIILHIHPSVSVVTQQNKDITLGQTAVNTPNTLVLPLARSTIRESDNIVRARNGQIVVIGGLMQNNMVEQIAGIPGVSRIPFIGAFFRRTYQIAQKSELVILLRPVVVESSKNWVDDMETSKHGLARLKRGFHFGGLPDVFGNEGERDDVP